jgi:hypothetical protein
LVIIKRNRSKTLAVVEAEHFVSLMVNEDD